MNIFNRVICTKPKPSNWCKPTWVEYYTSLNCIEPFIRHRWHLSLDQALNLLKVSSLVWTHSLFETLWIWKLNNERESESLSVLKTNKFIIQLLTYPLKSLWFKFKVGSYLRTFWAAKYSLVVPSSISSNCID